MKTSAILLAGGVGSRLPGETPKQFRKLKGRPMCLYSFERLLECPAITEVIVVCSESFQHIFSSSSKPILFAQPGERRQDSVYNGLECVSGDFCLIHDAARPLLDDAMIQRTLQAGHDYGAATTSMTVRFTVKEANEEGFVHRTPNRDLCHEIQTPQVLRTTWLRKGLEKALKDQLSLVDDVMAAEIIGEQVKLVEGSIWNLKVTTPNDLITAEQYLCTQSA